MMDRYAYGERSGYTLWCLNRPVISIDTIALPYRIRPWGTPICDICLAIL